MKTKHTPGPWKICGGFIADSRGEAAIAKFVPIDGVTWCDSAAGNETQANARLIAAAPELLAALQELTEGMQLVMDPATGKPYNGSDDGISARNRALLAISKATND